MLVRFRFVGILPIVAGALFAAQLALAAPIEIAEIKRESDVDFEKEILPIFRRNCLACHSATEAQSDLVLESPQTIMKGAAEGPSVVPGKGAESRLLKLASQQKEPFMPPPDNDVKAKNLTPQELGLIKLWIDQGAKGEIKAGSGTIAWQPLPPGINPIYAAAITPDGQYAAASRANQIFLYHVPSKRELGRLTDPALLSSGVYSQPGVADLDLIQTLKFSPDGTLLASGGFRTVKLWRKTVTMGPAAGDSKESVAITTVTFGPMGEKTASAAQDGVIRISETSTGKEIKSLSHGSPVTAIAVSPDGKRLASAGAAGNSKLWEIDSGKQIAELKGDIRAVLKVGEATRAVALAKKHIELAKKDLDDANARKKAEEENKTKSTEALTKAETELKPKQEAVKKSADEKTAAEKVLADATAAKAKAEEGKKSVGELLAKADAALMAIKAGQEAAGKIDSDEGKAARAAVDKSAAEVESLRKLLEGGKPAAEKELEQAVAAFNEADKKLKDLTAAAQKATDEQTAAQRTLDTAKRGVERANEAVKKATDAIPGFESLVKAAEEAAKAREDALAKATAAAKESENPVSQIAFSGDGATIVTVGHDGPIYTWDAATGAALEVLDGPGPGLVPTNFTVEWKLERTIGSPEAGGPFVDRVTALDFSPDGKTLVVGSGEPSRSGEIKLFSVSTGEPTLELKEPHSDTVNSLAFSPDGQQLASCAADRFIKLWSVGDGKFVRSFEGHTHHVLGVAWRADGRVLVSSGADMVLKIWDTRTGDQLRTVQNQFTKEVTSVSFVADDTVVACGGDAKVRFINATNGSNQREFSGPAEYMYSVAASADGKTVIAGGLDSILRIWNDQGQEQAKFSPPKGIPGDKTAAN